MIRSIVTCLVGLLTLSACNSPTPAPTPSDGPPSIKLNVAWTATNTWMAADLSVCGSTVYVPQYNEDTLGGLVAIDADSGQIKWRIDGKFTAESSAVEHGNDLFILASNLDTSLTGETTLDSTNRIVWLGLDGQIKGWFSTPSNGGWALWGVGDALFWTGHEVYKFDLSTPFVPLGNGAYDPAGHFSTFFPNNLNGSSMADQIVSVGPDVLFAYFKGQNPSTHEPPIDIKRMNATTGALVWSYFTKKAAHFPYQALAVEGDRALVFGAYGMEAIDLATPNGQDPFWAFGDKTHQDYFRGLLNNGVFYAVSNDPTKNIAAFSLEDGHRLWVLPGLASIEENPQYNNGVLYVPAPEGITVIDTAKGQWIGRDSTRPSNSQQTNVTVRYKDLMIHFVDDRTTKGRVEAIKMDVAPLP